MHEWLNADWGQGELHSLGVSFFVGERYVKSLSSIIQEVAAPQIFSNSNSSCGGRNNLS